MPSRTSLYLQRSQHFPALFQPGRRQGRSRGSHGERRARPRRRPGWDGAGARGECAVRGEERGSAASCPPWALPSSTCTIPALAPSPCHGDPRVRVNPARPEGVTAGNSGSPQTHPAPTIEGGSSTPQIRGAPAAPLSQQPAHGWDSGVGWSPERAAGEGSLGPGRDPRGAAGWGWRSAGASASLAHDLII